MNKVALITGINGQSGSYLAEILLNNGYHVHGIIRRSSNFNTQRIEHIREKLILHYGDMTDFNSLLLVIQKVQPIEIYNLAAQSHVHVGRELENYTMQVNTIGLLSILQIVKNNLNYPCKVYQASSSEMFGNNAKTSLNENSVKNPVSVYGISKLAAENLCNFYKNAYGMFVVSGNLFNHESSRRGDTFVTKKITNYCRSILKQKLPLELGNLNASRDWGHARDYMEAVYLMMQQQKPNNYVISTGKSHTVRQFCNVAFASIGISLVWQGTKMAEVGMCYVTNKVFVTVSSRYFRDLDIDCLLGDSTRACEELNWSPKTSFDDLVHEMMMN